VVALPPPMAAGDFNSDGRLDLAATANDNNQVLVVLRNSANTGFSPPQQFATGLTPVAIAVGDYNGDGLADLAIANENDDNVTILRRTATSFTAEATLTAGDRPSGIVAADFDGNGRADLAVANYNSGTVSVFLRNAANTGFSALAPIRISNTPVGIDAADFDRDGRPDIAVASNASAVDVLHRTATGFTRDQPIALAGAVNDVVAADFNGDARPDLAASSYGAADTFSALLNPAPPPPQGLPDPVPHKNVNALPKSGTVKIKLPGEDTFVALTEGEQIPLGTTVDTRKGRVTIVAAAGGGQTSDFYDGLFKLSQTKGKKPITTATLVEKLSGCKSKKKASAAAKKKQKRRLWGNGKGRFRTKGKHSAATVVGTIWLVEDRCTSTLTRVRRGKVKVRDFVKKKTVTVRTGKRYIARAKRR
jgi:VCBS repeat protein